FPYTTLFRSRRRSGAAHRRRAWHSRLSHTCARGSRAPNLRLGMGRAPAVGVMKITCTVNGKPASADGAWAGESLLYLLRERFGLFGSKNACEQCECGSCSVYLDGTLVCACLVLGAQADGREIVTIEGLDGAKVQQAFVVAGAVQCGFCTPGLVVAAHDLLHRVPNPKHPQVREALAGTICRCTGYAKIIDAVRLAAGSA